MCHYDGYRRVWAVLRRQSETDDMAVLNAKRVYRIMRQNVLLFERKPEIPPSKRAHTGKVAVGESNQRWCVNTDRILTHPAKVKLTHPL